MGVDYYNCTNCNEIYADCGDYYRCDYCEDAFCVGCDATIEVYLECEGGDDCLRGFGYLDDKPPLEEGPIIKQLREYVEDYQKRGYIRICERSEPPDSVSRKECLTFENPYDVNEEEVTEWLAKTAGYNSVKEATDYYKQQVKKPRIDNKQQQEKTTLAT